MQYYFYIPYDWTVSPEINLAFCKLPWNDSILSLISKDMYSNSNLIIITYLSDGRIGFIPQIESRSYITARNIFLNIEMKMQGNAQYIRRLHTDSPICHYISPGSYFQSIYFLSMFFFFTEWMPWCKSISNVQIKTTRVDEDDGGEVRWRRWWLYCQITEWWTRCFHYDIPQLTSVQRNTSPGDEGQIIGGKRDT